MSPRRPGAGACKLEDPRLPLMMAAPPRRPTRREADRAFVTLTPAAGRPLYLGELAAPRGRANRAKTERISISFNYGWR